MTAKPDTGNMVLGLNRLGGQNRDANKHKTIRPGIYSVRKKEKEKLKVNNNKKWYMLSRHGCT